MPDSYKTQTGRKRLNQHMLKTIVIFNGLSKLRQCAKSFNKIQLMLHRCNPLCSQHYEHIHNLIVRTKITDSLRQACKQKQGPKENNKRCYLLYACHRFPVEFNYDISRAETSTICRRAWSDLFQKSGGLSCEILSHANLHTAPTKNW